MKKTKKIVALIVAIIMIFAVSVVMLAACKDKDEGKYNITVWVSESDGVADQFAAQIKEFNKTNEWGYNFNAVVEGVTEADSATLMITDVATGADIFCFAQDQTARLVQANALAQPGQAAQQAIKERNDGGSVGAATVGDVIRAYPLTSDNGYFMMYDKRVISEENLDSLEALVAECEEKGYNFSMEIDTSAWYLAAFFFATGCYSEWDIDENGIPQSIYDNFNSDKGLIAAKGIKHLTDSKSFTSSSSTDDFKAAIPSAIVVSGTWAVNGAIEAIGEENLGMTDLPSFTVDGQSYHLGSYSGNKLMGVKPQSDAKKAAALSQLALYLTNAENQLARFNEFNWGPCNKEAQANEAVASNAALAALNKQNEYAVAQGNIDGSWWDIGAQLGKDIEEATDDAGLQAALDAYDAAIEAAIEKKQHPFDTTIPWGVVGVGDDWTNDIEMEQLEDDTWITKEAVDLTASDVFKLRQDKGWDVNLGQLKDWDGEKALNSAHNGENFTLEYFGLQAGSYKIKVVLQVKDGQLVGGEVTLIPAE